MNILLLVLMLQCSCILRWFSSARTRWVTAV